ncbi:MAG: hypothetical protein Q9171_007342 [Xanthocarpia ochracea]
MSQPEILVHVAAPSHGSDDVRYRKEALAILGFEAVKRHDILRSNALADGTVQASRDLLSQGTQQLLGQAQDSITSNDPSSRHQLTNAFSTWTTPKLPHPSSQIFVGHTPAPLHLKRASGLAAHVLIQQTPANQHRDTTAPSGASIIQETPLLRRSFSDAFRTPPSEIPDSQPRPQSQQHGGRPFEESSSPSPTHRDEPHSRRRKGNKGAVELVGFGDGTPLEDTSTPVFNNERQASSTPSNADVPPQSLSPSVPEVSQFPILAYRRRKADPPPPETSLSTTMPSQLTSSLKILRQQCTKILEAVQPLRPIHNRERGHWRLTFAFDYDEAVNNSKWNRVNREKMWAYLQSFIAKGCGGWGTWATFEEGKLKRFDGEDGWIGELGDQERIMGPEYGLAFGRIKVFCWGEVLLEIYALLVLATDRRVKRCGAQWIDSYGEAVVVVGGD